MGALLGPQPGRRAEAGAYFRQALDIGSELTIAPILLDAFLEIVTIMLTNAQTNHSDAAEWIELLTFVRDHPANTHEMHRRATEELDDTMSSATPMESLDITAALALAREGIAGWTDDQPPQVSDRSSSDPVLLPEWFEPLTEREMDDLCLIDQEQTNREIAAELVLTLGTVKWYTNQIYSKLVFRQS